MKLHLLREPGNSYGKSAIAVKLLSGEQIGYLSHHVSETYVKFIDNGTTILTAKVINITGGGLIFKRTLGVNIEIDVHEKNPFKNSF